MDNDTILFCENNVCDGEALSLKWGTLVLYPEGMVFYYNKQRDARTQDMIHLRDIVEIRVEKIDWLVSKIFWVGRKKVIIKTREGHKTYYLKKTDNLFTSVRMMNPKTIIIV